MRLRVKQCLKPYVISTKTKQESTLLSRVTIIVYGVNGYAIHVKQR